MQLHLYNTASHEVEPFTPLVPGSVGMYSCGMTVYYLAHVGHLRTYTNSDVLRRTLEYSGLQVRHVMNVTDVGHMTSDGDEGEDKLEFGARRENRSPWELARFYEEHFFRSIAQLNILTPTVICRATEHIKAMIKLIEHLERRGFTYRTDVGIIMDTERFPDYAKFARLDLENQFAGARVKVDPDRKNPWDFALWVTNQPKHIMQWDSPWGRGFPGWHIECSAMAMEYLGETIDIHTGGIDHIPVHHTNEIAQSEAATGKPFVRYWFHSAFLNVDGTKMSKSLGNLYTADDIVRRGFSPLALRLLYLGTSYRKTLNFTFEALAAAQTTLVRLWQAEANLPPVGSTPFIRPALEEFESALASDLNTSRALAVLGDVAHGPATPEAHATLLAMDRIVGLDLHRPAERLQELRALHAQSAEREQQALELARQRDELRKQRQYAEADLLRNKISEIGYVVEDSAQGSRIRPVGPKTG